MIYWELSDEGTNISAAQDVPTHRLGSSGLYHQKGTCMYFTDSFTNIQEFSSVSYYNIEILPCQLVNLHLKFHNYFSLSTRTPSIPTRLPQNGSGNFPYLLRPVQYTEKAACLQKTNILSKIKFKLKVSGDLNFIISTWPTKPPN